MFLFNFVSLNISDLTVENNTILSDMAVMKQMIVKIHNIEIKFNTISQSMIEMVNASMGSETSFMV